MCVEVAYNQIAQPRPEHQVTYGCCCCLATAGAGGRCSPPAVAAAVCCAGTPRLTAGMAPTVLMPPSILILLCIGWDCWCSAGTLPTTTAVDLSTAGGGGPAGAVPASAEAATGADCCWCCCWGAVAEADDDEPATPPAAAPPFPVPPSVRFPPTSIIPECPGALRGLSQLIRDVVCRLLAELWKNKNICAVDHNTPPS